MKTLPWRQDGGRLYRLTDDTTARTFDEILVTRAEGSTDRRACAARAAELREWLTRRAARPRRGGKR